MASLKLNVCCGKRLLDGYINIDIAVDPSLAQIGLRPDIITPAHAISLPEASCCEIICIHGWEHFYRWECDDVIAEWRRLLASEGILILELPDLEKCCRNFLEREKRADKNPDQMDMWGIYGDATLQNPYMIHRWGWTSKTLTQFLLANGFYRVSQEGTRFHPAGRMRRDMRLVATKK